MLADASGFYDWLNEVTDEVDEKAERLNIDKWEVAGLRDGAPQSAIDAFNEYKEMMARVRKENAEELQKCLSKATDRCLKCFVDYLDKSDGSHKKKAMSDIGLVKEAPQNAVKAYKEYQEIMKAAKEHGIKL
jgi:hypothetical protein